MPTEIARQARFKAGPLLKDIFNRMTMVVKSNTNVKMDIYRVDDYGIAGILNALGLYDYQHPEVFASIFIELFQTGIYFL